MPINVHIPKYILCKLNFNDRLEREGTKICYCSFILHLHIFLHFITAKQDRILYLTFGGGRNGEINHIGM